MQGRLVRSLVLAFSLVLVLPQHWCCIFAIPTAPAASVDTLDTESPGTAKPQTAPVSCGSCCARTHDPPPHPPPDENPPAPAEKQPPEQSPGHCPCSDHLTLKPSVSTVEKSDVALATVAILAPP